MSLPRRSLLRMTGFGSSVAAATLAARSAFARQAGPYGTLEHAGHAMGPVGRVSTESFDPGVFLRTWNFSDLPSEKRQRYYRETRRADGSPPRRDQLFPVERQTDSGPGVCFPGRQVTEC